MVGQKRARDRWLEIAEQATIEQDSEKFRNLVHELNWVLHQKQERLDRERSAANQAGRPAGRWDWLA
jgi:hypothetical protein